MTRRPKLALISTVIERLPLTATPEIRGHVVVYRRGEQQRCPGCGGRAWEVGRTMAECANPRCCTALPIAPDGDTGR